MQKFTRGQSAQTAHQAILASIHTMNKAKQHAVLWYADIKKRRLYRDLGYPSMNMYATGALGFSSSRASDFSRLADKLDALPRLRGALEAGKIGYTKANQVAAISNKDNEAQWLAEAEKSSRRELEGKIKRARSKVASRQKGQPQLPMPDKKKQAPVPAAVVPVRLTITFSPEQYARYEALQEKIHKMGRKIPGDRAEALLELLGSYLEHEAPPNTCEDRAQKATKKSRRRESAPSPFQVHLHQCPDCARTTTQTSRGELPVDAATVQRAECDARMAQPGQRNQTTIAPRTRREVLTRDRHKCQRPGCGHTRFLEVHHIIPRMRGGSNDPENLQTLCAACHQLLHEKKWVNAAKPGQVREKSPIFGIRLPSEMSRSEAGKRL